MTIANATTNEQLASMSSWQIAETFGCHFSGDANPIEHGGFFYDARDWEDYGYASCVEFWEDPETHALIVQPGTIRKWSNDRERASALQFCGIDEFESIHAQIDACRYYLGIEPDGTEYPYLKAFNLETWSEKNIWKSVRGWIEQLGK